MKLAEDIYARIKQRLLHEAKTLDAIRQEMEGLASAYHRYADLQRELEGHRDRMFNILRLLGPDRATEAMKADATTTIRRTIEDPVHADDLHDHLPIWKAIREYVREGGESRVGEIQAFLTSMGMKNVTRQAIESAVRRHESTFRMTKKGRERFVALKKG